MQWWSSVAGNFLPPAGCVGLIQAGRGRWRGKWTASGRLASPPPATPTGTTRWWCKGGARRRAHADQRGGGCWGSLPRTPPQCGSWRAASHAVAAGKSGPAPPLAQAARPAVCRPEPRGAPQPRPYTAPPLCHTSMAGGDSGWRWVGRGWRMGGGGGCADVRVSRGEGLQGWRAIRNPSAPPFPRPSLLAGSERVRTGDSGAVAPTAVCALPAHPSPPAVPATSSSPPGPLVWAVALFGQPPILFQATPDPLQNIRVARPSFVLRSPRPSRGGPCCDPTREHTKWPATGSVSRGEVEQRGKTPLVP